MFHHLFVRWAWLLAGLWTGGGLAVLTYCTHRWEIHGKHSLARVAAHAGELFRHPSIAVRTQSSPVGGGRRSGTLNSSPESSPRLNAPSLAERLSLPHQSGLVSVVIPTYNRAHILGRAIDSVLSQTYQPVEVIVADDGSIDRTPETVARYDRRVRYVRQNNAGVSAARNLGLREAQGEFIALLDSDDQWLPWKLELQVAAMRAFPEVGMVWTDMVATDESGASISSAYLRTMYSAYSRVDTSRVMAARARVAAFGVVGTEPFAARQILSGDLFPYMLLGNLVHTSTVMLRRERVKATGGFDESLRVSGEDYEFHLNTCYYGPVAFIDISSVRYRVGANDQLTAPRFMLEVARNNLTTVERWLGRAGDRLKALDASQIRGTLANAHSWLGVEEYDAGNRALARRHLGTSIRLGHRNPRTAALFALSIAPRPLAKLVSAARRASRSAV